MRYWWVNQNQTYVHEVRGGYLWSPKRKSDGTRNPFYEFMREVAPGDMVFSFADARIRAFGFAQGHAYEAPKPIEFQNAGRNWDAIGWRVDVGFAEIPTVFRPADWMAILRPHLPTRYAPLLADGRGIQSVYLTELPRAFALELADLLGSEIGELARTERAPDPLLASPNPELLLWEEHLRGEIDQDPSLTETERQALTLSRRGQGLFRKRVQAIEQRCRITGVDQLDHLRASHIKPWRDSNNAERLAADNGLMLTPTIDHLFDRGFISFQSDGRLLVSPVAHQESLGRMGIRVGTAVETGGFTPGQAAYLEYHRDAVFLEARRSSRN